MKRFEGKWRMPLRRSIRSALAVAALSLVPTAPALCQEEATTGGAAIGKLMDALRLRSPPKPAEDFVRQSRPANGAYDYAPLPGHEPARQGHKKSPQEMEAIGASLQSARAQAQQRAARVKIPDAAPAPKR